MEAAVSSEALVPVDQFTWHHITRDHDLEIHCQTPSDLNYFCYNCL